MNKNVPLLLLSLTLPITPLVAEEKGNAERTANTVVLDEIGVKNLRIQTLEVEETDFEETVFSLGRIEAIPGKTASVSSRISGRIVDLTVAPGDTVQAGDEVVAIESRQPGSPPPVIALKSPISGLVTRMDTQLGDPVEPDRAILVVTDLSEVYAVARVPEHEAGRMKPGTKAHIKVSALPDEPFQGELLRFGTSADKQSGTIDAIFRIKNSNGLLRADMRAEFSIVLNKRASVLSVPRAALQGEAADRFVYVKDFDIPNAFVKTKVQVGQMNDRFVEIVGGLFPSDEVVTRGAYSLSFAGASSVSLREALDAAHGHAHAEDGSELTPEKQAELDAQKTGAGEHAAHSSSGGIWMYVSGGLFVALMGSLFVKRGQPIPDEKEVFKKAVNSSEEVA